MWRYLWCIKVSFFLGATISERRANGTRHSLPASFCLLMWAHCRTAETEGGIHKWYTNRQCQLVLLVNAILLYKFDQTSSSNFRVFEITTFNCLQIPLTALECVWSLFFHTTGATHFRNCMDSELVPEPALIQDVLQDLKGFEFQDQFTFRITSRTGKGSVEGP